MKTLQKIEWAIFIALMVLLFTACSGLVAIAYFDGNFAESIPTHQNRK